MTKLCMTTLVHHKISSNFASSTTCLTVIVSEIENKNKKISNKRWLRDATYKQFGYLQITLSLFQTNFREKLLIRYLVWA